MTKRIGGTGPLLLDRKGRLPIWISLAWRASFVIGLFALAVLVHWFERDGLKDNLDGHVSLVDIIYFTMISVTTTGYGDIVPVTDQARLFDALVVTPIRIFVVLIFLGTAYSFIIKRTWNRWRMTYIQRNLSNHIIVAGYGISGSEAVSELITRGILAADIVVIDPDEERLEQAKETGCAILSGDATRDQTLRAVRVEEARAIIVSAGRDDTSILITLTARHLAPKLKISVAVKNEDNEILARQAGATTVINPVSFAGLLLAESTEGQHITDYISDLASSHGHVQLSERVMRPDECGKPLSQITTGLGVRIYRNGKPYGFWEKEAQSLLPGDCIVEILPTLQEQRKRSFSPI